MAADDPVRSGRVGRMLRPAALAGRATAGQAGTWLTNRFRSAERRDEASLDRLVATAEDAVAMMGEMKGAVMKIGQLFSFADLSALPPEFQQILAQLQADAPAMEWSLIEAVVVDELGAPPHELFDHFGTVPMAAASIGQVHSARMHDGTEVVVKIQYPGVAEAIEADLANTALLSSLAKLAQRVGGPFMPRSNIDDLVEEMCDRISEELDYRLEARSQQQFADLYASNPYIRVPDVVPELSTGRVLTSAYHDGMRWNVAVEQPAALRDQWGEVIYRFVFTSLYHHHVFNADPHPGNYLFHEDGTVTFLDFGCTRTFTPAQVAELQRVGVAILAGNADELWQAAVDAGVFTGTERIDPQRFLEWSSMQYEPILADQPFTYSREWAAEAVRRQTGLATEYLTMFNQLRIPRHQLFLGRITLGVMSVLTGLQATGMWRSVTDELWFDAQPVTTIGREIARIGGSQTQPGSQTPN